MIHLRLPETKAGKAMAEALQLNGLAEVVESDSSLQLASVDERMKHTLQCLEQEKTLVHGYDYVWIMRYINEEHIKATGLFGQRRRGRCVYAVAVLQLRRGPFSRMDVH